jgi:pyruvate,orthophosphate dikinase
MVPLIPAVPSSTWSSATTPWRRSRRKAAGGSTISRHHDRIATRGAAADRSRSAEFFSFGTNDLTQTTFGISRDDAARFLGIYTERGILPGDPFVSIDREGVGALMRIGIERGRAARKTLKLGICGEHGGDPASVSFCHELGLDYVSCSPFRVPIARLAAAQAALGKVAASTA